MSSNLKVKLLLEAVDRISSPIRRMTSRVRKSLNAIRSSVLKVGKAFKEVGRGITDFGKGLSARVSAPLLALGVLAVKKSADFEDFAASLETATGSAKAGKKAFDDLVGFTENTPFQLEEVMGAFIKLKNLGLDPSQESLISYGNTASAMGKSLDQFIEAVADASTFEFERLKEFGIKARQQGEKVAFTFQGNTVVVRKNAAAVEEYLKNIGDERFAGAMEKRMKGLNGIFSNFSDTISRVLASFGDDISETLNIKEMTQEIIQSLKGLLTAFKSLPEPQQKFIIKTALVLSLIGPLIIAFGQLVLAVGLAAIGFAKIGGAIAVVATILKTSLIPALIASIKAIIVLGAAFLAMPFGLIIAGIMAVIAAGYLIISNWDKIKVFWINLWDGIKQAVSDAVDYVRPLIEWMSGALNNVVGSLNSAKSFMTDNTITRGISGLFSGQSVTSASTPFQQSINAGGTLNIKIDSEGKANIVKSQPNDNRMNFNVENTGLIMGGAF